MSKKKIVVPKKDKWVYNKSRVGGDFKKIAGFEEWFYTGPSRFFGHVKPPKKNH